MWRGGGGGKGGLQRMLPEHVISRLKDGNNMVVEAHEEVRFSSSQCVCLSACVCTMCAKVPTRLHPSALTRLRPRASTRLRPRG